MAASKIEESAAQRELAAVLRENGESAHGLRTEPVKDGGLPIHRTKLWLYSTGRGKPNVETAAFIERVTDGRVKANGWTSDVNLPAEPPGGARAATFRAGDPPTESGAPNAA